MAEFNLKICSAFKILIIFLGESDYNCFIIFITQTGYHEKEP